MFFVKQVTMRFCDNCENMYYIRINADEPNKLVYYCRNCGNEDKTLEVDNVCVSKTQLKARQNATNTVNKYTKYDPTLPRVTNINCPNEACLKKEDKEIVCIRADDANMKYKYICCECDTTWST
jgi:DNA-directed RNA polymerase subunit M/transcription elongation factor TFIIS